MIRTLTGATVASFKQYNSWTDIGFLETADAFLDASANVERPAGASFETSELPQADGPLVVAPAAP